MPGRPACQENEESAGQKTGEPGLKMTEPVVIRRKACYAEAKRKIKGFYRKCLNRTKEQSVPENRLPDW